MLAEAPPRQDSPEPQAPGTPWLLRWDRIARQRAKGAPIKHTAAQAYQLAAPLALEWASVRDTEDEATFLIEGGKATRALNMPSRLWVWYWTESLAPMVFDDLDVLERRLTDPPLLNPRGIRRLLAEADGEVGCAVLQAAMWATNVRWAMLRSVQSIPDLERMVLEEGPPSEDSTLYWTQLLGFAQQQHTVPRR
ncbi:hypothetical protein [Deinococcus yavapaiensis]|uniref:Uncharacterized protein n=1 Tax=Deinococcus yavapaiensis KR-236 TaxID=694435 RepID=A0A318SC58_9DEIO|nr:hypothetical protein [Deinococcus yavapaiensis]PYE53900.1 hypothetical protein DES52_107158 [Deinococcus yavapaiensis KR-236]